MTRRAVSPRTQSVLSQLSGLQISVLLADFMESVSVPPFGLVDASLAGPEQAAQYRALLTRYCRKNPVTAFFALKDPQERALCFKAREEAIQAYSATLAADADPRLRAGIALDLGMLSMGKGSLDQAAERLRTCLRYAPEHFRAKLNLGICHEQSQRYDEAAEIYAELHASYPNSSVVLTRLAAMELRLQRRDVAFGMFEKALRLDRRNAAALVALGALCGDRGDFARALEYSKRAIVANPDATKGYQNAAVALSRMNRSAEALEYVERGLRVAPQDATLRAMKNTLTAGGVEPTPRP